MDNKPVEEVQLDLEAEDPPPLPSPAPGATGEADEAAQAFSRLEGEMAMMRRAVQHLAAERADIVIPDYTPTLGQMAGRLEQLSESLVAMGGKPALKLTPEAIADQIRQGSLDMQRDSRELFSQGRRDLDFATGQLGTLVGRARTQEEQQRYAWRMAGAGLVAGILLWSILPGTIARAMPERWHWPERLAGKVLGESSRWNAGGRLLRSADPLAWLAIVEAADLQRDNRDTIEACRTRANSGKRTVSCTIEVRAQADGEE